MHDVGITLPPPRNPAGFFATHLVFIFKLMPQEESKKKLELPPPMNKMNIEQAMKKSYKIG